MFRAVKNDTGAVQPWEYLDASAGTYKVGQLLKMDGELSAYGDVAIAEKPAYQCMADVEIPEGEVAAIPVVRVTGDTVFETEGDYTDVAPGSKVAVYADGRIAKDTEGAFEITQNLGGAVRGRFV